MHPCRNTVNGARTRPPVRNDLFISPIVEPATATVEVHALFPNANGDIPTGVPCDLLVPEFRGEDGLGFLTRNFHPRRSLI
jgi:hypothetical protein